jgi:hypothetical protein
VEDAGVHLQYHFMADGELLVANTPEAAAHRAVIAEFLGSNDGENTSLGIELDIRYDDSPVVCAPDTEAPPWNRRTYVPTVRAGHRAPDVVVGTDRTLFDGFGPGFTLVDTGRHPEAKRLIDEAAHVGMPLHHLIVEDPHCRSLYQNQLVLVRGPTCTSPGVATQSPTPRQSSGEYGASQPDSTGTVPGFISGRTSAHAGSSSAADPES